VRPRGMVVMASGRIDPQGVLTHRFALADYFLVASPTRSPFSHV